MTTLTIIGDPHAKPDNLDKIEKLFDIVEELGNPCVILGDTLDTKEIIRGKCLNTIFRRVSQSSLEWVFIIGNHCKFHVESEEHSLEVLKALPNVTIVDRPTTKWECYFFPYMHDVEELRKLVRTARGKVVFGHMDVQSMDYGNGFFSEHGLSLEDLKDCKTVISGHYHKYQQVDNLTYLGTPFSHSFGESNQTKYIGLFDTQTAALELLETPFPRHVTVEATPAGTPAWDAKDLVRVVLKGPADWVKATPRAEGVKYIEQAVESISDKPPVICEAQSPEVQFERWARDIRGLDVKTVATGMELLRCFPR